MRASKENKSRRALIGPIERLTKVTLPKLDFNDPDSLAAFASPDSFDSQELDDEILSIDGDEAEWREPCEEDEEDEDFFDEDIAMIRIDKKRWHKFMIEK